ncbi:MAG: winged helix-turn-helix transcriptional regulator [Chthoniobacteraceae bacterium]
MKQRLLQTVARSARLKILNELKRTQGLAVADLAERLGMSYMGVKGLCVEMEKRGLLDTWRQPVPRGRPQMLYRLTQRAHDLFPVASNDATLLVLEASKQLFGAVAPEKLLLVYFQKLAAQYEQRLRRGEFPERAKWFARLRDHDGYMSDFESRPDASPRIVEHHSPLLDLHRAYPIVAKLETELFQRVLGVTVKRTESVASGLFLATFELG